MPSRVSPGVRAAERTGRYHDARVRVARVADDALALGFAPLAAEALLARGGLEQQDGDLDAARATLVAAAQLAGSARDDAMLAHVLVTFGGVLVERAEVPARANANDVLYQDVAVPAGTTRLVLTGYYEVRSGEGAGVFDRGKIELVEVGGAVIEQALALDNSQRTTAWTPIAVTLGAPHGGETVRLRLSTSSNASNETSFFFDSLALTATSCL